METSEPLGTVVDVDRGSLPYALVHGESLIACASWALGDAEVQLVDIGTTWADLIEAEAPVVLHDSLCPLTPSSFIAECIAKSAESGAVVVGVRPVTDTVKRVEAGRVGETVDRSELWSVASPIVLPADVVASLKGLPSTDFARLVEALAATHDVQFVTAPPEGRRISSAEDIAALEALAGERG